MRASLLARAVASTLWCNRRGGKPRSKAVLHPVPWPQQNDASSLYEEHAKVAIAALGDTPEDRSITRGYLLGGQTEPRAKSRPRVKAVPLPIAAPTALEMIGPIPGIVIKC
jgi:hypothetical protein